MDFCLATIMEGQSKLAGRIIMLECQDIPQLHELYGLFGFKKLERINQADGLIQMIRILHEDEMITSTDAE